MERPISCCRDSQPLPNFLLVFTIGRESYTLADQGGVAFYLVRNFVVGGCSLEDSRSDGTHFDRCREGRFVNNRVLGSKMGGYFVEWCDSILAANNLIRGNGSCGVTIEAGSRDCTLQGNVIEQNGREGLWAPDLIGLVV